ncbi:HK97 gp10 family phage protein [Cytobacillus horneckiae]|uniref:HK97-gp10 family putative phage morphogenesis protein n=1 Tax=Cytobacillus horneckiae TaxID=549687 RepID=UPI0019D0375C|nr:HK97-gp10 family putative phage morphogenesis protein [Cytobacillus horneckiae]MBN6890079.1 HK97 gp10 family phage protein [Cytobacillus horneckiae]
MARSSSFSITGIRQLQGKLKRNATLQDVKNILKLNGSELDRRMKRNAIFVKGYSIGDTKRSISLTMQDNGFTAKVAPTTNYSPFLEYGTRFMSAQPFVYPSFTVQKMKFLNDLTRVMK